jgi:transposase-like protein
VDLLRGMVRGFAQTLMSADFDAVSRAEYGTVSDGRVHRRNGYRTREWDTRAGTAKLAIPKLRQGSYSGLVAQTAAPLRVGPGPGRCGLLPGRGAHPQGRQAGQTA